MSDPSAPSLLEWMGGPEKVDALIARFYDKVVEDPLLQPLFGNMHGEHAKYVAMFISEVFHGPDRYTQTRGGHPHMIRKHLGKAISEPQRQRWVSLLLASADELGVPNDPEFRSAFLAYIEWGSRLAVINSQPGAIAEEDLPMPKWGWGEVGGPYSPE